MMTWPEQQLEAGWLSKKRRPKGDDVYELESDSFYRVPMSKNSHKPRPDDLTVAWCGFPMQVDPDFWMESGWEEVWGPWYTIPEGRKTGTCSQCKTKSKSAAAVPSWRKREKSSMADEIVSRLGAKWEWERRQYLRQVYAVAAEFNGEVVE